MTRSLVGEVETLFDVYRTQRDQKHKETLIAIQREEMDDPFGWIIPVAKQI